MEPWSRPRFQLTVHKTRDIKIRSKSGTHDIYVIVSFADEKHKTSSKEKCIDAEWNEDCFLKLLSTNEDTPVKIKLCNRNIILHDEVIGELEILLKHYSFYERPLTGWFSLKSKAQEDIGEILLTLAYHATTPKSTRPTLRRTNSLRFLANKLGKRLGSRKNLHSGGIVRAEMPRSGGSKSSMVDFKTLSESFQDMHDLTPVETNLMKTRHDPSHRHTIDFSSMQYAFHSEPFGPGDEVTSTPKLKPISISDASLRKFESFDSLDDYKKPFSHSTSSISLGSDDNISNIIKEEYLKSEEETLKTDHLMANLNSYSKQELVQLIMEQREWIKTREVYILDLHSYLNTLLQKILDSNCSILQKNCQTPVDECHKLTTFKPEETSVAKRWISSLFGQRQKS